MRTNEKYLGYEQIYKNYISYLDDGDLISKLTSKSKLSKNIIFIGQ